MRNAGEKENCKQVMDGGAWMCIAPGPTVGAAGCRTWAGALEKSNVSMGRKSKEGLCSFLGKC